MKTFLFFKDSFPVSKKKTNLEKRREMLLEGLLAHLTIVMDELLQLKNNEF